MLEERQQRAAHGAPGAQYQHALARKRAVEVGDDIAYQAHAVEVFGIDPIAVELHGVDGAGHARALRQVGGVGEGVQLERRGDIQAAAAAGAKCIDGAGELAQFAQNRRVLDLLADGLGKHALDQRRFGVPDGVADNGVFLDHAEVSFNLGLN